MKIPIVIIIVLLAKSACSKPLSIDDLYGKCKNKKEYSIINYMAQFQVVMDISAEQLRDLFDKKTSKTESVDLCECFVKKLKKQTTEVQKNILTKVQVFDKQLQKELKLFAKKGVLGKLSYPQEYEKIIAISHQLPNLKQLLEEASENKFNQQLCIRND